MGIHLAAEELVWLAQPPQAWPSGTCHPSHIYINACLTSPLLFKLGVKLSILVNNLGRLSWPLLVK